MKKTVLVGAMCVFGVTGVQTPVADFVLDVVTYPLSEEKSSNTDIVGAQGGMSSSGEVSPLTKSVKVTLLSLERDGFQWGDACIYEVLVENRGTEPFTLPWSPDYVLFPISTRRGLAGYRAGALGLEVLGQRDARTLARLKSQPLYGADAIFGSLQTLAPGQRAVIRVPGQWWASEAERSEVARHEPAGLVRVAATLDLFNEQVHVRSANDVAVRVSTDSPR